MGTDPQQGADLRFCFAYMVVGILTLWMDLLFLQKHFIIYCSHLLLSENLTVAKQRAI